MTHRLRAIGFDLDNTLYDQAQHMRSFFRVAAEHVSEQLLTDVRTAEAAFLEVWMRRTSYYPRLFDEALAQVGVESSETVTSLVRLYHEHRAELSLFDGVEQMLDRLRTKFALFMITDGNERMQRTKIRSLGLDDRFDEIIVTASFGKDWAKPAPHAFRRALDRFGGNAGEYIYVGDNPACDFYGARQLGMRTMRVLTAPFGDNMIIDPDFAPDMSLRKTTDLEDALHDLEATV